MNAVVKAAAAEWFNMHVVVDLRECVWFVARSNKLNKMRVIAAYLLRLFPLVLGLGLGLGLGFGFRFVDRFIMGLVAAAARVRRRAGEKQLSEQGLITAMAM